jgi:hypothetical protein
VRFRAEARGRHGWSNPTISLLRFPKLTHLFREEAYKLLKASKFFGTWDDDVLKMYVEHGMIEDQNGGVKLKCAGFNVGVEATCNIKSTDYSRPIKEAVVFADKICGKESWTGIADVDPRIAIKWIVPPSTGRHVIHVLA